MNQQTNGPGSKPKAMQSRASGITPMPAAPAVYRPQPTPKVLQLKSRTGACATASGNCSQPPVSVHRPAAEKRAQGFPTPNRPVMPRPIQTKPNPTPNNKQFTARNNEPPPNRSRHVTPRVVQRTVITDLPADVIVAIMNILGMRTGAQGRPEALNFALTSKRMYHLSTDQHSHLEQARRIFRGHGIPAILQNYAHTLEPLRHGAHLGVERLGLPGSGTILGLAINGQLIPWFKIPEDFLENNGLKVQAWEEHVKNSVLKYSELSILARTDREYIQQQECTPKQKRAMQKESTAIMNARKHSPAATFQVFLLMNRTLSHPAMFEGHVMEWLERRRMTLLRLLFETKVEEYELLRWTEEEESSCGHSEQLMLMKAEWENIRSHFFHIAKVKMEHAREWIQPQQVVIMLNRSPCTSCGRLLVAELTTFWEALAEHVGLAVDACRARFRRLFVFRLGYTVKYGKVNIPKDKYPNAIILAALKRAGWELEKLPKFTSEQRQPESCFDTATLSSMKRKPVDLSKIKCKQEDSDSEYSPSYEEDDDDERPKNTRPKKKDRTTL